MRATKEETQKLESPTVISEDDALVVFNKPAGWITTSASTTTNQPVLQKWLEENFTYPIFEWEDSRAGIVHRLDKETSGCIIVAKTKDAFNNLQSQFKEREIQKTYLTLVHGEVKLDEGEVDAPVGRLPWRRDRFGVLQGGRSAVTIYKVINRYKDNFDAYTLLEVYPKTGRTHQIRIHMKYLNHPVVSDTFYAGRKTVRKDRNWCRRLFLHAQKIEFKHPSTNKTITVEAPLPWDLKIALDHLN